MSLIHGINASNVPEPVGVTDGDAHVAINGGVSVITGTLYNYILAPDDATAVDAALERYNDATGVKAFRVTPIPDSVGSLVAIIFGWSTTVDYHANVAAKLDAMDGIITTPDGSGLADVGIIVPGIVGAPAAGSTGWWGNTDWIGWDGTNRIKTIVTRSSGADHDAGIILSTIE